MQIGEITDLLSWPLPPSCFSYVLVFLVSATYLSKILSSKHGRILLWWSPMNRAPDTYILLYPLPLSLGCPVTCFIRQHMAEVMLIQFFTYVFRRPGSFCFCVWGAIHSKTFRLWEAQASHAESLSGGELRSPTIRSSYFMAGSWHWLFSHGSGAILEVNPLVPLKPP